MFLTLDEFLSYFPSRNLTFQQFQKQAIVTYSPPQYMYDIVKGNTSLTKRKDDIRIRQKEQILNYFYELLVRHKSWYLTQFYCSYFQFRSPRSLLWTTKDDPHQIETIIQHPTLSHPYGHSSLRIQRNDSSKRLLRNLFYRELLDETMISNTVKSNMSFWNSLLQLFNNYRIEDRLFAPSSISLLLRPKFSTSENETINYNHLFYLFQAYQPKASLLNPYSITYILHEIVPRYLTSSSSLRLFSPVLSWGSYLVAFMESHHYSYYLGNDVIPSVCQKTKWLGQNYPKPRNSPKKYFDITQYPAEHLLRYREFRHFYTSFFDVVICCPPYYKMEEYKGGEQSTETYKTYEEWLTGFWKETVRMIDIVLRKGGVFLLLCNDYQALDGTKYPIIHDLNQCIIEQWNTKPKWVYDLINRTSPLRITKKERLERMFIYVKPY